MLLRSLAGSAQGRAVKSCGPCCDLTSARAAWAQSSEDESVRAWVAKTEHPPAPYLKFTWTRAHKRRCQDACCCPLCRRMSVQSGLWPPHRNTVGRRRAFCSMPLPPMAKAGSLFFLQWGVSRTVPVRSLPPNRSRPRSYKQREFNTENSFQK